MQTLRPITRIVTVGPESTGKSTLSQELARHFDGHWVAEYARQYLTERGMDYQLSDLSQIARGQLALEEQGRQALQAAPEKKPFLFADTDLQVVRVWSEFVFDRCEEWILRQIAHNPPDLYLLCHPDLPWQYDPLREYPDEATRHRLLNIYREILVHEQVPWVDIRGRGPRRLDRAVDAVREILPG